MENPLIITLKMDEKSQAFFDAKRRAYFPIERNILEAHLMVFHQLPAVPQTIDYFKGFNFPRFSVEVSGLMKLGRGVAYRVQGKEIMDLHRILSAHFSAALIPQDRQGYRPHVTVQNKVDPLEANVLFETLSKDFTGFSVGIEAIQVWTYLGGPWRLEFEVLLG